MAQAMDLFICIAGAGIAPALQGSLLLFFSKKNGLYHLPELKKEDGIVHSFFFSSGSSHYSL